MKKNEHGIPLDRNGYAPSIVDFHSANHCWACGMNSCLEKLDRHEIFGGPNRSRSKADGLWVYLHHTKCHEGAQGVHQNPALRHRLQQVGQLAAMERYNWTEDDFRDRYGRSYV